MVFSRSIRLLFRQHQSTVPCSKIRKIEYETGVIGNRVSTDPRNPYSSILLDYTRLYSIRPDYDYDVDYTDLHIQNQGLSMTRTFIYELHGTERGHVVTAGEGRDASETRSFRVANDLPCV